MNDIRRTMLWVVFSMSLIFLWDAWQKHNGQPSMFSPPVPKPLAAATDNTDIPKAVTAPGMALASKENAPVIATEKVEITTDLVKAVFDTRGGDIVRLELLHQRDPIDKTKNVVLFDFNKERPYLAQTGLVSELQNQSFPNHSTAMALLPGVRRLEPDANELSIQFESPVQEGVKLTKTFTFNRGSYVVGVKHEISNVGQKAVKPQLYFQIVRHPLPPVGESKLYFTFTGPVIYTTASKFIKMGFDAIAKQKEGDKLPYEARATDGWIGMVQHYYASAWMLGLDSTDKTTREFSTVKLPASEMLNERYAVQMVVPLGEMSGDQKRVVDARLFAGPQEEDKLSKLAPGLELVKDYGVLTLLAKPLFWLLTQLHNIIGNWGWAIVALVVLLKIAFYWLNASAYRSMAKMKAVAPRITDMRERLKDKPQEMQQEMMRIYREEKINPLGGCLPILAQMPFFIALYWVLLSSVEMRNAPWVGWITDLSAIDPYYILPLLMTGTSLLQTWLNPTPPDPMQAKLMWIMPLVFSVMFFFFPAGLVLYWLTNNILSITQQYLINKQLGVLGK
ncbi:MAG: membrane protein insertase YidC [Burkholderiales bacterium]